MAKTFPFRFIKIVFTPTAIKILIFCAISTEGRFRIYTMRIQGRHMMAYKVDMRDNQCYSQLDHRRRLRLLEGNIL
jgi:hypothetical protein